MFLFKNFYLLTTIYNQNKIISGEKKTKKNSRSLLLLIYFGGGGGDGEPGAEQELAHIELEIGRREVIVHITVRMSSVHSRISQIDYIPAIVRKT